MYYDILYKLKAICEQELKRCKSEYAKCMYELDIRNINNFLKQHEQKIKDKEMKKQFSFTIEQAKALRSLLEDKITTLELAKNDNFIEKSFYHDLHKYINQRITDAEKA